MRSLIMSTHASTGIVDRTSSGDGRGVAPLGAWLALAGAGLAAAYLIGRRPTYDVAAKVVLVTGASRGLGLILARQLSSMGARVAICARDQDTLERARQQLAVAGSEVLALRCDVASRHEMEQTVSRVQADLGNIDVLINNAGIITVGPLETMTHEDFEQAMAVNFWGPLNAILAVLPHMRRRRQGRIVNIASIGGKISVPHLLPYGASKFALVGLSEGLRAELAADGIVVTTVCPGLMRTGSPRHASFKGQHRAEYAWFSVSDALPGTSMDAERAARQVIRALRAGTSEVVLTTPAKLAAGFHGLMPGLTTNLLSAVNRLLPSAGPSAGAQSVKGRDSGSWISPSWLTALGERAAGRYNQAR